MQDLEAVVSNAGLVVSLLAVDAFVAVCRFRISSRRVFAGGHLVFLAREQLTDIGVVFTTIRFDQD